MIILTSLKSATAVEHLLELQDAAPEMTIPYFYFDFTDAAKQRFDKMARSILYQTASRTEAGR
jgi:hypothetical protein